MIKIYNKLNKKDISKILNLTEHYKYNRLSKGIHFNPDLVTEYHKNVIRAKIRDDKNTKIFTAEHNGNMVAYAVLEKRTWDSKIFDMNCWALDYIVNSAEKYQLKSNINILILNEIKKWTEENNIDFVIARIDTEDIQLIQDMCSNNYEIVETIIWLSKKNKKGNKPSIINNDVTIRIAKEDDIKVILKRVSGLFSESRFYKKNDFNKSKVDRMYKSWIENSFSSSTEDIYIAEVEGKVAGFWISKLQYDKNDFGASIGVGRNAAVFPEFRGKAILKKFADFVSSKNMGKCKYYDVSASVGNYASINSLIAVGFKVVYSFNTFHYFNR